MEDIVLYKAHTNTQLTEHRQAATMNKSSKLHLAHILLVWLRLEMKEREEIQTSETDKVMNAR